MRAVGLNVARAALLAGPTVLAFFTGGYFETQQAVAGLIAWLLVVVALLCSSRPLLTGRDAWLAIGGLGALGAWTLLSITWAPVAGSAYQAGQIVMLYTGALLAAAMLLRGRAVQRTVEPALAAGALIVIGYGISERLLPGLLHFSRSITAEGRLEQPLTYWNAMGELAALGFVLCARLSGDRNRPRALRMPPRGRRAARAGPVSELLARCAVRLRRGAGRARRSCPELDSAAGDGRRSGGGRARGRRRQPVS